ncbi:thiamine pyrophosphate enzyme [Mariannaea sp. PMI_226]|nr:thiamine pyrophosphate enzyme [Mariannaea sp. PMI_226]
MSPSATIKAAEYLFQRLRQLGIDSIHGVPGDYNLTLLDLVQPSGLRWVGNANELNAGYAADGYARIKGMGAVITTFGVGELSAVNAIAGAYAERAAVVHIVGSPTRLIQQNRIRVHHTFNDGNFDRFAEMYRHVTVAQTRLWDPRTIPEQIDSTLQQCLLQSRPVYIDIPVDVVDVLVSARRLETKITSNLSTTPSYEAVLKRVMERVYAAKQPAIIVDGEIRAIGIVNQVQDFVRSTNWPTWVMGFGKGLLDETLPNFHGVYRGKFDTGESSAFLESADLILCFGPHFSSTNTFAFSSIPAAEKTISFSDTEVNIGGETVRDIAGRYIVPSLVQMLDISKLHSYTPYPSLPRDYLVPLADCPPEGKITQDKVWGLMANFFRAGDIIMGETGTAGYGVRHIPLPPQSRLFTPVTWLSIGYMLPAAQGAALAQQELMSSEDYCGPKNGRTVLFIGDGSFQMTVQELSTIIRHNLNIVVFLINNDGYTIERCIHGLKEDYNDVAPWRYLSALHFFGAPEGSFTARAKTWAELGNLLVNEKLADDSGLRMVEVIMDRDDAPPGPLLQFLQAEQGRVGN